MAEGGLKFRRVCRLLDKNNEVEMSRIVDQVVRFIPAFVLLSGSQLSLAEPQLYETGPSEESSYVRFVNVTDTALVVTSSKGNAKIDLNTKDSGRVSAFFPVKSGAKLNAAIQGKGRRVSVDVVGKPWEYITIAVLPDGASEIKTKLVRETPTDFNAMRASLSLFNLDEKCAAAVMQGGTKNATILDKVEPFSVQRRLINPVKLNVTIACGGQGVDVDLSQLQAGERYSVFLRTIKNNGQAFFVRDSN